ncbi:MAG: hypothetical protein UU81_C0031G0011 [Microgenomates group bacterium GW2011_GWC1_41_8]|uniref:Uncharacterized protein n=2 Tax=Candidatus Roizmaniibacteriota TaxID=1752723 RepID=A0A0G0W8B9_9BACT|nr:MAG: hypothetical protein UU14_C0027G0006 [Candidatus Roizmanbacteria bacterium GW2011_GWB1_40_7]KKR93293.1 MAG: hypothetical protein UU41_C0021G0006 [Candidatus Roizmanbacteria bacterium GW2011_GWA1_41_13]KKS23367.1 MAG: hypothetical protein UU81_C0031G0011 [Microgenomates group bacterium GW2011_GWC1_41_8]
METISSTDNPDDLHSIPEIEQVSGEKRDDENIEYYLDSEGKRAWRFSWRSYYSHSD